MICCCVLVQLPSQGFDLYPCLDDLFTQAMDYFGNLGDVDEQYKCESQNTMGHERQRVVCKLKKLVFLASFHGERCQHSGSLASLTLALHNIYFVSTLFTSKRAARTLTKQHQRMWLLTLFSQACSSIASLRPQKQNGQAFTHTATPVAPAYLNDNNKIKSSQFTIKPFVAVHVNHLGSKPQVAFMQYSIPLPLSGHPWSYHLILVSSLCLAAVVAAYSLMLAVPLPLLRHGVCSCVQDLRQGWGWLHQCPRAVPDTVYAGGPSDPRQPP